MKIANNNTTMTKKLPYNVTTSWNPLIDDLDETDPMFTNIRDDVSVATASPAASAASRSSSKSSSSATGSSTRVHMTSTPESDITMSSLDHRLSTLSLHSKIVKNKSKQEPMTTTTTTPVFLSKEEHQFDTVGIACATKAPTALSFTPGLKLAHERFPKTPDGDTKRAHKACFHSNNDSQSNSNSTIDSFSSLSTTRSNISGMTSPSPSPFSSSMMPWEMMLQTSPGAASLLATPPPPPQLLKSSTSHDSLLTISWSIFNELEDEEHGKSGSLFLSSSIDADCNHGAAKLTEIAAVTTATAPMNKSTTNKVWSKRFYPASSPSSLLCPHDLPSPFSPAAAAVAKNPKALSTTTSSDSAIDDLENLLTEPLFTSPAAAYKSRTKKEPRIGPSPPPLLLASSSMVRLHDTLMDKNNNKNRAHQDVNTDSKNETKNETSKSSNLPFHCPGMSLSSSMPATTTTTTDNKNDARCGKRPSLKRMDNFSDYY
jgi:hypothetical protein